MKPIKAVNLSGWKSLEKQMTEYNNVLLSKRTSWLSLDSPEVKLFQEFDYGDEFFPVAEAFVQLIPEWANSIDQIEGGDLSDLEDLFNDFYLDEDSKPKDMWKTDLKLQYVELDWRSGEETTLLFDTSEVNMLKQLNEGQLIK